MTDGSNDDLVRRLRSTEVYLPSIGKIQKLPVCDEAASALESQSKEIEALRSALEPFAAFAALPGFDLLPDEMTMTPGSRIAARQVIAADFRRARTALKGA